MLSKSIFQEGEKFQIPFYLQPSDLCSNALQGNQDAFSMLILSHCRCRTLKNPEECKAIWCWMSSCRLPSSETYSDFKNSHYSSHQIEHFGAGDNSLVIISRELAFNLQSRINQICTVCQPIDRLEDFFIITAMFQLPLGYHHHVVFFQAPPFLLLDIYVD